MPRNSQALANAFRRSLTALGVVSALLLGAGPAFGQACAKDLSERLWNIDRVDDVAPLIEALAK